MNRFNIGDSFETTVVAVTDTTVFVDLSAKSEGVIDAAEFKDDEGNVTIKEGDKLKVYFTGEFHGEMRFTTKIGGKMPGRVESLSKVMSKPKSKVALK